MRTSLTLLAILTLALGACGDNIDVNRADARDTADADPNAPDAAEGTPDANETPDASSGSSVTVTADCTGIDAGDIVIELRAPSTSGFRIMGETVDNPPLSISVGDVIAFQTNNTHNFAAGTLSTAADADFESGTPGAHRACLTFTAAFVGDYQCDVHPGTMNGTLTVLP